MNKAAILDTASELMSAIGGRAMIAGQRTFGFLTHSLAEGVIYPLDCVSATIEEGRLSLVKVSKFLFQTRARHISERPLDPPGGFQPDVLASKLSMALKEIKADSRGIVLVIPDDWILMRTIDLPVSVRDNICDVVAFELDRLTPLAAKDAFYDFQIIGESEGRIKLTIFASKADHLNPYLRAFNEQGVTIARMTSNLSALTSLSSWMNGKNGTPSSDKTGKTRPVADIAKLNPDELKRRLGLNGKSNHIPYQALGAAIDVVSSGDNKGINLLTKGQKASRRVSLVFPALLMLILAALLVLYARAPLEEETKRVKEIEFQIGKRKEVVKKTEALRKEVDVLEKEIAAIEDFKQKRPMTLAILKEITAVLPKSAWVTRARITDTTVELEGYAASASEILPKLEQSRCLRKVEFASPTIRDQRMNADRFVMKMEIEGFDSKTGGRQGG